MADEERLPSKVPPSELALPVQERPASESKRAFLSMLTRGVGAVLHAGPARTLLEPALKQLEEAQSLEEGLARFHSEATKAFAEEVEPAFQGVGGDFLLPLDLGRSPSDITTSIRSSVDAMASNLLRLRKPHDVETALVAHNHPTRIHLDLLHLEFLFAVQLLAANQRSAVARGAFLSVLHALLDQAKRSYLAD